MYAVRRGNVKKLNQASESSVWPESSVLKKGSVRKKLCTFELCEWMMPMLRKEEEKVNLRLLLFLHT